MEWRRATPEDLPLLTASRLRTLRAANGLDESADMTAVAAATRAYYERALTDGTHMAFLALEEGEVIATGGVSFYQLMPTCDTPDGRHAYVMNMYTRPDHRRRGVARRMLALLVEEAHRRGVTSISLEATAQGRGLYESFGFVPDPAEMTLPR